MNVLALTRQMVDIESITGNELAMGEFVAETLRPLVERFDGHLERMEVEAARFNILAHWGDPIATLSTHLDTVPPFFPSREDNEFIWGRGACDVKGIIAAMICAAEQLLEEGERGFGLLFVVGEERNSLGAQHAAAHPRGSKFLINGEPTENRLALGSKGTLRFEIVTQGRMAHSAYPHLGESAIEKLLTVLNRLRILDLPADEILGPSTLNIGVIAGGRAPNVIPDHAQAEILIRLVSDPNPVRASVIEAAGDLAEAREVLCVPSIRLGSVEGFETCVVAYTTDIPSFDGKWGTPFLLGPGTIHVAHTSEERVPKKQLQEAIGLYSSLVKRLLKS